MKILVTGTAGFIGKQIATRLGEAGHEILGTWRTHIPEVDFSIVKVDLSSEFDIDFEPDVIVHAAGALPYRTNKYIEYVKDNIDSMRNLITFAKKKMVRRFVNLSTIGVYGEFIDGRIDEESDIINPDAYGATKYIAENLIKEEKEIKSVSLRMPGIIGAGARGVWLSNIIEKMKKNEDILVYTPNFVTKNFVWIDDLTMFISKLVDTSEWKYDTLILACKNGASIKDIVFEIKRLTGSSSNIIINNDLRKPFCLDATRAFEMGYKSIDVFSLLKFYLDETDM